MGRAPRGSSGQQPPDGQLPCKDKTVPQPGTPSRPCEAAETSNIRSEATSLLSIPSLLLIFCMKTCEVETGALDLMNFVGSGRRWDRVANRLRHTDSECLLIWGTWVQDISRPTIASRPARRGCEFPSFCPSVWCPPLLCQRQPAASSKGSAPRSPSQFPGSTAVYALSS